MDNESRAALVQSAASDAHAAAKVIAAVNATGVAALDDESRAALVQSAARYARAAARAIEGLGAAGLAALDEKQCAALLRSAARSPAAAAYAIERLGAAGFAALDAKRRTALLRSAVRTPAFAARVLAGLGAEGLPHWTRTSAACSSNPLLTPPAAARTALTVGDTLLEPDRHALRAALLVPDAALAIPHAVAQGARWRPWMIAFAPGTDADAALKNVWMPLAPHLPPSAGARAADQASALPVSA